MQEAEAGIEGRSVRASCGVSASNPGEPFNFDSVYARADRALYAAKAAGGLAVEEGGAVERFGAAAL